MKLELNVVRMANEDVIATSGVCSHIGQSGFTIGGITANHIQVSNDGLAFRAWSDNDNNGELDHYNTNVNTFLLSDYSSNSAFTDVNHVAGYYYWNGYKFVECDKNCSHPKEQ